MGLTAEHELQLQDVGLTKFYDTHRVDFADVTQQSFDFAADQVQQTGFPLRRDDVCTYLVEALKLNEKLRDELARLKLRQKYWYQRFADLILDREWDQLRGEDEG